MNDIETKAMGWLTNAPQVPPVHAPAPLPEFPFFYAECEESEHWIGPFASKELAIQAAKEQESNDFDGLGAPELIWVATGKVLDPADHLDSEQILDWLGDDEENCPVETTWTRYLGLTAEDFKELDRYLAEAFRSFARDMKLKQYWQIQPETMVKVILK